MSTPKSQRIGIWVIAVVMMVGTLGSFAVMVMSTNDSSDQQADINKQLEAMKAQQEAQKQAAAASEPLDGYSAAAFDAASVTELQKEVLVQGEGAELKTSDTVNVDYFGWLPDGTIFDSSKKSGKVTPIDLPLTGVIKGWTEGLTGEKVGSTIKLTIPADKAYGAQGQGSIPANTPLTFILTIHSVKES
jgi:FKBP-type peptidyl-prolyl cis-trans isomerase FkpA